MSDQERKQETSISPQPDAENKKGTCELTEDELKKISGGLSFLPLSPPSPPSGPLPIPYPNISTNR